MEKLAELATKYKAGSIDKPAYIAAMYSRHHADLFDYAQFLAQTNIQKIEIADAGVIMTSRDRGLRIQCIPGDTRVAPIEILNFGDYEKSQAVMMERLAADATTIFDIGANIGWYALIFAAAIPNAMVYAFEPLAATYAYLETNIRLNTLKNIRPYNLGLSDNTGTLTFYVYPEGSWNASAANLTERPDVKTVTCAVQTLDAFVAEAAVQVDFIKCDVEGAELLVFQGGAATIMRDKPVVCAEVLRKWSAKFNYSPNDVFAFFRQCGYHAFVVRQEKLSPFAAMDETTVDANFIFLHAEKHQKFIQRYVENKT